MPEPRYHLYCLGFPNGKKYIGLTSNVSKRRRSHRCAAKSGSLLPVHKAIRKHGLPPFCIVCVGSKEYIADLEVRSIAALKSRSPRYGYNVFIGGSFGPTNNPEVAAKISVANKGRLKGIKRSPEVRAKISVAKMGIKLSSETIAKLRAAKKGQPSWNKGKPFSAETRAKMSRAQQNRSPISDETRAKMSATRRGVARPPFSAEHRAKIAAARKGRKCPEVADANRRRRGLPKPRKKKEYTEQQYGNKCEP